jgi:hypothetical protein
MHSFRFLNRRGALMVLFGLVASSALATGASPMEGTWGGADAQGRTAQITIVGNQVIGVFWGQDYHDAENVRFQTMAGNSISQSTAGRRPLCVTRLAGASPSMRPTVA